MLKFLLIFYYVSHKLLKKIIFNFVFENFSKYFILFLIILGLLYWLHQSLWLCTSQQTGEFSKGWEYQITLPASWEICKQVKKQQLEPDVKQQTGSK